MVISENTRPVIVAKNRKIDSRNRNLPEIQNCQKLRCIQYDYLLRTGLVGIVSDVILIDFEL